MSRVAIRKIAEDLKRIEASIAPKLQTRVTLVFDDGNGNWPAPSPGAISLGFE